MTPCVPLVTPCVPRWTPSDCLPHQLRPIASLINSVGLPPSSGGRSASRQRPRTQSTRPHSPRPAHVARPRRHSSATSLRLLHSSVGYRRGDLNCPPGVRASALRTPVHRPRRRAVPKPSETSDALDSTNGDVPRTPPPPPPPPLLLLDVPMQAWKWRRQRWRRQPWSSIGEIGGRTPSWRHG